MPKVPLALIFLGLVAVLFSQSITGEQVDTIEDLVERDGLYYKKFSDVPFTGEVIKGEARGRIRHGKSDGDWLLFYGNGQLFSKGK